jgi:hypothetical protein
MQPCVPQQTRYQVNIDASAYLVRVQGINASAQVCYQGDFEVPSWPDQWASFTAIVPPILGGADAGCPYP